jgi:hypothetical protein
MDEKEGINVIKGRGRREKKKGGNEGRKQKGKGRNGGQEEERKWNENKEGKTNN